jgi:hypothetical protein
LVISSSSFILFLSRGNFVCFVACHVKHNFSSCWLHWRKIERIEGESFNEHLTFLCRLLSTSSENYIKRISFISGEATKDVYVYEIKRIYWRSSGYFAFVSQETECFTAKLSEFCVSDVEPVEGRVCFLMVG